MLISQKLKNKMKHLKPVSKEPHELVIEIHEEVDYLVKRLVKVELQELLKTDADYLSAIYSHLPENTQMLWDNFDLTGHKTQWEAFSVFLYAQYQSALRKRALVESLKEMKGGFDEKSGRTKGGKCFTCNEEGHKSKFCPQKSGKEKEKVKANINKAEIQASNDAKNECPCCKKFHTFQPKNKDKPLASTRLEFCPDFKNLDLKGRADLIQKVNGCIQCLSWLHKREDCRLAASRAICTVKVDGNICGRVHNNLLHGSMLPFCQAAKAQIKGRFPADSTDIDQHACTQGILQDVPVGNSIARVQWDGGANKVLVTFDFAKRAGLQAIPAEYLMQVVGEDWKKVKGPMYSFDLQNNEGKLRRIWGYGIEKITDPVPSVDMSGVRHLFPHLPDKVFESLTEKPLDILVGLNFLGLHPEGGQNKNKVENLRALKSEFSNGWVIAGSHPNLKPTRIQLSTQAIQMATIKRVEVVPAVYKDFMDIEKLGVESPKRCHKCKMCKFCSDDGLMLSCQEEEELKLIEDGVTVKDGNTYIRYPFIKDPYLLQDNRFSMIKRSESLEKSLKRKKHERSL